MKFILILGVVLLLQGVVPCEGGQLFEFFRNFLARKATTMMERLAHKETGRESFDLFFRDIIEAHLYAKGHLGWNETLTVPPSTTPEVTTPPTSINLLEECKFALKLFSILFRFKVNFFVSVLLY